MFYSLLCLSYKVLKEREMKGNWEIVTLEATSEEYEWLRMKQQVSYPKL
jgi:hypothetical protein